MAMQEAMRETSDSRCNPHCSELITCHCIGVPSPRIHFLQVSADVFFYAIPRPRSELKGRRCMDGSDGARMAL